MPAVRARRMSEHVPGIVVAGVASGVGKTTVTLGLLAALRRRGLVVQAFKVGPDFIDPGFHRLVSGRPSYSLDGWMCGRDHVLATYIRRSRGADLAVVEGVMGCFDGRSADSDEASTAEIAKWLGLPVILVVDVRAQSRSAAAVVQGFERFDADLDLAGVILNRAGGERHARTVQEAIASTCRATPLGALVRDASLGVPERHLGLVTAVEGPLAASQIGRLADAVERAVDLDAVMGLARARSTPRAHIPGRCSTGAVASARARIGVAHDVAFQFYYEENLDRLREAGAELVFWSPVTDGELPDVDGLYFGGGYPELHASSLTANARMRSEVHRASERGTPIYAECGGLMYLGESLEDHEGVAHAMVGVLPATVRMRPRRLSLGYTDVRFVADTPLGPAGTTARGHEFHYSIMDAPSDEIRRAWAVTSHSGDARPEGYLYRRTLMTYVHLHFGSNPALAAAFVETCVTARRERDAMRLEDPARG